MKLIRCLWFLGILLWLMGCSEKGNDGLQEPDLDLSVDELIPLRAEGETISFSLTSNTSWSIVSEQEWCAVSPTSGKEGTTEISVRCLENQSYDERNSALIFHYGNNGTKKLLVVQKQHDALLLSSNKVEMDAEGGEAIVIIHSNMDYECSVESDASEWIKFKESSRGLKESRLNLSISENNKKEKRIGQVIVKSGLFRKLFIFIKKVLILYCSVRQSDRGGE